HTRFSRDWSSDVLFRSTATLFDYLDERTLAVVGEGAGDAADQFHAHVAERYEQRRHDVERPLLPPGELYLAPDALRERLNGLQRSEERRVGEECTSRWE